MTAIDYNDIDVARTLMGDSVPAKGTPAAWWITTNPELIAAFDRYRVDFGAGRERVEQLAQSIGLTADDALMTTWGDHSELTGFVKPYSMGHWDTSRPDYRPIPTGWRFDKKSDRLVPSRKTKADRESDVNKAFAAVRKIPNVRAYMKGLPTEIYLDDRDFGGTIYGVNYRRGAECVWAYSGGDPDRQSENDRRHAVIDTSIWHRMKLSVLIALREEQ